MAGTTSASTGIESTIAAQAKQAGLTPGEVAGLRQQIDEQLARTPGGKQIGLNQVSWRGGKAIMTFPLPGEGKARAVNESAVALGSPNCGYGWTCLYEHSNFDGRRLTWSDCNFEDLGNWGFNDRATSWHNNQTQGTKTWVYNWAGDSWQLLWESTAPSSSSNVDGWANDRADGIRVC
ncbi:peptidase inhibitor family I36 protein [Streptomyces sp. NBC_01565]|uniref:peptidase inhibitor family I36 protein n=1 Tax=unclassified Streptomyces TaxID=2593676 RepID=UPI00224FF9F8|nr:peptidase inhibitor family I36 protein [Streptomyces sp. NBC_01565]MCX4545561.1 peptidase inhibitor family I36 protein [Streptomyces sp. NBC_01565]